MSRTRLAIALIGGLVIGILVLLWLQTPPRVAATGDVLDHDAGNSPANTAGQEAPAVSRTVSSTSTAGTDEDARGMCAQTFDDAAAFAEMERNAANPIEASQQSADWYRAEVAKLQRNLADSRDPEFFLAAHLLDRVSQLTGASDDASSQAKLLDLGLRAADAGSPILAWHALRDCVGVEDYCPFPQLEQELLDADRDNAESWVLVATLRYRRGDVAGALAAMQGATRASTSTWYWFETIAIIERTLAEQTTTPFLIRAGSAFGILAASGMPGLADVSRMCGQESVASRTWGEACLAFGNLRGEFGKTVAERGTAYSLRKQALIALGDLEAAAEVAEESALYDAERLAGGLDLTLPRNRAQEALITSSPERFRSYLSAVQEFGETEGGRRFFRQEVPPLLERAGLLDRDGARECVAQFFEFPEAIASRSRTFRDYPVEEYPIQVGDQLQITVPGRAVYSTSLRVGTDGMITMPLITAIAAVGKTTAQIEREIAAILSERSPSLDRPPDVFVILISGRSLDELRLEFDNSLREAAASRE